MKKCDLFKADKKMSARVEEYVKVRVLRKAIMLDYNVKIKAIDDQILGLEKLVGSLLEDTDGSKRARYELAKADLINKRNDQIAKEAIFELTEGDKAFKKSLKGANTNDKETVSKAVIEWFKNYKLDVTDTQLLADILDAIGGKEDYKKLVNTDGVNGLSVDNNRALSMLYWVAFNHMATVGTIKPALIPSIIADKYAKKGGKKNGTK